MVILRLWWRSQPEGHDGLKHQKGNAYPEVAQPVRLPGLLPGRTAGAFWRFTRAWATYGTGGYPPRVARRLAVINVL